MYNRYHGNTGRVERVAEPGQQPRRPQPEAQQEPARPAAAQQREKYPPGPLPGLSGEFGRLLHRLSPAALETEDFLLICILYLLYRESGDEEFLFAIGGLLLL